MINIYSKNSIVIETIDSNTPLDKYRSKIGGNPDLPKNFKWPVYREMPLSFLMQLNCEDIQSHDSDNKLPTTGMLYFFYELDTMAWGYQPEDKGCSQVYYYNEDLKDLLETEFPTTLDLDYRFPEKTLSFNSEQSIPNYGDTCLDGTIEEWEAYDNYIEENGHEEIDHRHKVLGHADIIQNPMTLECELVDQGVNCGEGIEWTDELRHRYKDAASEWQLLLQIDTVTFDDKVITFGDCGRLYFYIREEALKTGNFDQAWSILQC